MSEYIFFEDDLRDRFLVFVAGRRVQATTRPDKIAGHVVTLPEGLSDDLEDAFEAEYGRLMDEQQRLVEAEDDADRTLLGVDITLPDGRPCTVRLPPDFARRLCNHFSGEEIQAMVATIARDVLDPTAGPICRER
ncbi:MAG: hypothetical protein HZC22_01345 [Rhodocyclales bacterium]|jgi:hypothetical protein|nr:hypothetical protein [Rhodocyclales bacterium]